MNRTWVGKLFPIMLLLEDVFTPAMKATHNYVGRRDPETAFRRALLMPGIQVCIWGEPGTGKTSLVHEVLRREKRHGVFVYCAHDSTLQHIRLMALEKLHRFYNSPQVTKSSRAQAAWVKSMFNRLGEFVGTEMRWKNAKRFDRLVDLLLTDQCLAEFMTQSGIVLVIENTHLLKPSERAGLARLAGHFADACHGHKSAKLVFTSRVPIAAEMATDKQDLRFKLNEITIPHFTGAEIAAMIRQGEELLNIRLNKAAYDVIIDLSGFNAGICHFHCYQLCAGNNIFNRQGRLRRFTRIEISEPFLASLAQATGNTTTLKIKP